jgi:predicted ArsR family transcriptional regulator
VDGATLAERASALADVLSEQGFMAEVEPTPEGLRLCQHNCTVEHLATELPDLCASEAKLFERLLGTPVEREATIVQGDVRCVTQVHLDERAIQTRSTQSRSKRRNTSTSPKQTPARSEA